MPSPLLAIPLAVVLAGVLVNCGNGNVDVPIAESPPEVKEFRRVAYEIQKREPLDVDRVTIQLIQIPHGVSGHMESKPNISMEEAEAKAADLYKQAVEGADFDRLVMVHSYDSLTPSQRPGVSIYVKGDLPKGMGPSTFSRESMDDTDLWKAAWRLKPGEIGTVEWHHENCPSAFYVLRRLTDEEIRKDNPANFEAPNEQVTRMRGDAAELMKREEHDARRVRVQHLVISRYMTSPSGRQKILQPAEAEKLAAVVYAKALEGADFTALVEEYTYDSLQGEPTGAYTMVANDSGLDGIERKGMVPGFGDAAWRLEIGEIGVVLYDQRRSFYGYHIIKRLE